MNLGFSLTIYLFTSLCSKRCDLIVKGIAACVRAEKYIAFQSTRQKSCYGIVVHSGVVRVTQFSCFIIPLDFLLHFASSLPPFWVFVCQRGREPSDFHHHLSFTDATELLFPLSDIVSQEHWDLCPAGEDLWNTAYSFFFFKTIL